MMPTLSLLVGPRLFHDLKCDLRAKAIWVVKLTVKQGLTSEVRVGGTLSPRFDNEDIDATDEDKVGIMTTLMVQDVFIIISQGAMHLIALVPKTLLPTWRTQSNNAPARN